MQPALLLGSLPYFQQFVLINNFTVSNISSRSKILGVLLKLIVDGTNMLEMLLVKCTFEEGGVCALDQRNTSIPLWNRA